MSRLRPLADTQYHSWFPPQFISSLFCRDRSSAEITLSGLTMFDGHIFDLDLPRSRGRVSAFGHIVSCRDGVSPVGAVGNGRSTFSKGLVDAFLASTGPAASVGTSGIA